MYWFSNPELYFDFVEVMTMMIAFYNAMWIVNFSNTAVLTHNPKFWSTLSIFPGIFSFFLFIYVIKCSSILSAITTIDGNVLEETIEQSEDARNLGLSLKNKIITKLSERSTDKNPEDSLLDLFNEIDENDSQLLSRAEFQILLNALEITFSRSKWRIIFREIDRNFDDEISFDEMFLYLFPEHGNSKAEERKRLKLCGRKVKESAKKLENRMNISDVTDFKLPVFSNHDSYSSIDIRNFRSTSSFSFDKDSHIGRILLGTIICIFTLFYILIYIINDLFINSNIFLGNTQISPTKENVLEEIEDL
jgi:Ca2+-binding EF-hand superfamily protein